MSDEKICPMLSSIKTFNKGYYTPDIKYDLHKEYCKKEKCALWVTKSAILTTNGTEDISECGLIKR